MNVPMRLAAAQGEIRTSLFNVPGIHCSGCIAKIERGLVQAEGVRSARVNFTAKRVRIEHHPDLDEDEIQRELRRLGFVARSLRLAQFRRQLAELLLVEPGIVGAAFEDVGLAAEALELGMGSIAARPPGEHGLRQQRFAPTRRQSLAVQVLGMHAPDPHRPTVSAGVADGRKPSIETALLH